MRMLLRRPWWTLVGQEFRLSVGAPLLLQAVIIGGFRASVWLGLWKGLAAGDLSEAFTNVLSVGLCLAGFPILERAFSIDLQVRRYVFLATLPMRRSALWAALLASRVGVLGTTTGVAFLLWPVLGESAWLAELGKGGVAAVVLLAIGAGAFIGLASPNALVSYAVGFPLIAGATALVDAYFDWAVGFDAGRRAVGVEVMLVMAFAVVLLYGSLRIFVRGEATDARQRTVRGTVLGGAILGWLVLASVLPSYPALPLNGVEWQPGSRWAPFQVPTYSFSPSGRFAWFLEETEILGFSRVSLIDIEGAQLVRREVIRGLMALSWHGGSDELATLRYDRSPLARLGFLRPACFERGILDRDGIRAIDECSEDWKLERRAPGGRILDLSGNGIDGALKSVRLLDSQRRPTGEGLGRCGGTYEVLPLKGGSLVVLCLRSRTDGRVDVQEVVDAWIVDERVRSGFPGRPIELRSDLGMPVLWSGQIHFDPEAAVELARQSFGQPPEVSGNTSGYLLFGWRDRAFGPRVVDPTLETIFYLEKLASDSWRLWSRVLPDGDWSDTGWRGDPRSIPAENSYLHEELRAGVAGVPGVHLDGGTGLVAWSSSGDDPGLWVFSARERTRHRIADGCRPGESGDPWLSHLSDANALIVRLDCRSKGGEAPRTAVKLIVDLDSWIARDGSQLALWGEGPIAFADRSLVGVTTDDRLIRIDPAGGLQELWRAYP
ncbi:MAG: hypothetical protein F9K16_07925 [Thermoanaerobaculia bacterium]|nr:MAG: hypothetical protein F9K16_07925 [Thermoanaerobaculia bacterium]